MPFDAPKPPAEAEISKIATRAIADATRSARGLRGANSAIKAALPGAVVELEDGWVRVQAVRGGELVNVRVRTRSVG